MLNRRKLRRAIPEPLRQRLYDWNPSRRRSWRQAQGIERTPAAAAALTFDDGPDPEATPMLLDVLDELGAKATFFVVGERLEQGGPLLREMRSRGHEIALHGMTHRRHDKLAREDAMAELRDGLAAIERAAVPRPRWYRPPYGASSPVLARCCEELGLELVYWSSWGQDWDPIQPARIASLVCRDIAPGAVILLHDSALYAERDDARATIEAMPIIAGRARAQGLELISVGEAVDRE